MGWVGTLKEFQVSDIAFDFCIFIRKGMSRKEIPEKASFLGLGSFYQRKKFIAEKLRPRLVHENF